VPVGNGVFGFGNEEAEPFEAFEIFADGVKFFLGDVVFELGGDLRFGLGGLLLLFNGFNDSLFGREKIEAGLWGLR